MKMIVMLKLIKRNGTIALSTIFNRLFWPSLLPFQSISQQLQKGFTQHLS